MSQSFNNAMKAVNQRIKRYETKQRIDEHKPFDSDLYTENDSKGKYAVSEYLRKLGYEVKEGDKYGVDLLCYKDNELAGYVEVEVRHNWQTSFNFSTLHIPYRKHKFFNQNKTTLLFATNKNATQALWVRDTDILISPVENKPNKYMESEMFFVVPLSYCTKVYLQSKTDKQG